MAVEEAAYQLVQSLAQVRCSALHRDADRVSRSPRSCGPAKTRWHDDWQQSVRINGLFLTIGTLDTVGRRGDTCSGMSCQQMPSEEDLHNALIGSAGDGERKVPSRSRARGVVPGESTDAIEA